MTFYTMRMFSQNKSSCSVKVFNHDVARLQYVKLYFQLSTLSTEITDIFSRITTRFWIYGQHATWTGIYYSYFWIIKQIDVTPFVHTSQINGNTSVERLSQGNVKTVHWRNSSCYFNMLLQYKSTYVITM